MVALSSSDSRRDSRKLPKPGTGFHGGIVRQSIWSRMSARRLKTSAYVMSENGACSPGRWHVWQRSWTIRTTSSLNVGVSAADPTPDRASVGAIPISQMCFMISARPILPESSVGRQESTRDAHPREIVSGNRQAVSVLAGRRVGAAEITTKEGRDGDPTDVAVEDGVLMFPPNSTWSYLLGQAKRFRPHLPGSPHPAGLAFPIIWQPPC